MKGKYFSVQETKEYYSQIKKKCDHVGFSFSVCFDKAANFEGFRYQWANKENCCCAKDMNNDFTKTDRDVDRT